MWRVPLICFALVTWVGAVNVIRKSVSNLTDHELYNLQSALHDVVAETGPLGYQAVSGYHGAPASCDHDGHKIACCIHGMPTFPLWHRAYTVQMERALLAKRDTVGMPYWDWTEPMTHLPDMVSHSIYVDSYSGKAQSNFWHRGSISFIDEKTARAVDDRLFEKVEPGHHTHLMEGILDALEQDEFCKFEIQFELAHNAIHFLVGGRYEYSMSHLEYTSYDPIFFLHHSNVDRIFAIWQRLQELRGKNPKAMNCAQNLLHKGMEPFSWDSNPLDLTKDHSQPAQLFDYHQLGYSYDNLNLNGMTPEDLKDYLDSRSHRERTYASFRLKGFGASADVHIYVCLSDGILRTTDCEEAGYFFVLGGEIEMPWSFYRPYLYDITDTVHKMGLDGKPFYVKAKTYSSNGTALHDVLPQPTVYHRPRSGYTDEPIHHTRNSDLIVRKNVETLTNEEVYELRDALERFQQDLSVDGYQATVEYHGLPARCPTPDARNRFACCVHGMATFPHWHRLFVTQVEDALVRRGLHIGIPYWDWTKPMTHLPALADNATYTDHHGNSHHNPFLDAPIKFEAGDHHTARAVDSRLFEKPAFGHHTHLFEGILYAFEQEDFCDFEVQFEVTHNNIHAWVGGSEKYSMSSLHYTAFDPIFYLHHSNVDRLWAIWQSLQIRRHKPYRAHCALGYEMQPLKPFAFASPLNNNEKTHSNAVPTHVYDYEEVLHYTYDDLTFNGMTLEDIENEIHKHQQHDRVFAGFYISGIGTSANVDIFINKPGADPHKAGSIAILGGSKEMKWGFDRMFKYEITEELKLLHLDVNDEFSISVTITDVDGTPLSADLIPAPAVVYEPAHVTFAKEEKSRIVRRNVDSLSPEEINDLRHALQLLEDDKSPNGFQQLGMFHGEPKWCPNPEADHKYACCVHGMAVFPHWHRLLTVQAENGLRRHGYHGALPYWDWTRPLDHLPHLVLEEKYTDPTDNVEKHNPWFNGHIDLIGEDTKRDVRNDLFAHPDFGHYTKPAQQVLLALEQDDFCTFEVQYEIAHNFIHALVGGTEPYGMASLRYTAYDPIFFLHHSNTDRIWAIWQALQKYRGKPYNSANCALAAMRKPLQPFGLTDDINPDKNTHEHAVPFDVFDYRHSFHYEYDHLDFNGLSVSQLNKEIERIKSHDRVFAGFLLSGFKKSSLVKFQVCTSDDTCHEAGEFYLLGDENEMPWAYDRVFKYDITSVLEEHHLHYDDHLHLTYEVFDLTGASLGSHLFPNPNIIHIPGTGTQGDDYHEEVTAASHIRKNLHDLSIGEMESLRAAFLAIEADGTYEGIAKFHGKPGLCGTEAHPKSCCIHGMPTFPQWHRLYVVQVENKLLEHGSAVSVPYWDWTEHITELPPLINAPTYYNSRQQRYDTNPFFRGKISFENAVTTRDPRDKLFNTDYFSDNVLLALEQTEYCDFEIQFELIHNALHSMLGGKGRYSMSSLDYTAFDPVFFLHHANTDRIWAIWQELQKFRGLHYDEADCAINLMHTPITPFSDPDMNHDPVTLKYSKPQDVFDYENHFRYKYDNLRYKNMNIQQLDSLLKDRKRHDRVFAGFLLHNIGTSADVDIYICPETDPNHENCDYHAGWFSILGGETEMPFAFDRLYKYDITPALHDLGIDLFHGHYDLHVEIHALNGSAIDAHIFNEPTLIFEPGTDSHQDEHGDSSDILIRKEISRLSPREKVSLVNALTRMQHDHSADGYQAIASFHALPPLCPSPSASERFACCVHGMATFPQWHRLYTVQVQDALKRHGATVGIPYWDWTKPVSHLPELLTEATFHDPIHGVDVTNPFLQADIEFEGEGVHTSREINSDRLFHSGTTEGYHNWFFENTLFALEQENYCDFEIQFEILHNGIHTWVGGSSIYGLGHLHYASYDPLFYIHHSQTDRIWAIWQELQRYRGFSGSEAHCAVDLMRTPLKPFSFGPPYNLNHHTHDFSKPEDTFDYKKFGYEYDSLELEGRSIAQIDTLIKERQAEDRTFAGFLLKGFGSSATVDFKVCRVDGSCKEAGYFTVLGGEKEMPWSFDRLYKYEITHTLEEMHLRHEDAFTISATVTSYNGSVLSSDLLPTPSIIFEPGTHKLHTHHFTPNRIRRGVESLTERDMASLKSALLDLQKDHGDDGFSAIAAFHGLPAKCHDEHDHPIACCIHGMPTFPHWHRLYTLHMEQALRRHGSSVAIPYWDWTKPISKLPRLLTDGEYYDAWIDSVLENPFARGYIEDAKAFTVRDVQDKLYHMTESGDRSILFDQALLALEQTDYCDFEVQFEVMHNTIHYLVGGRQVYALSSLHYASYDPAFFIHHSFVDKIWAVWEALQRERHEPYDRADCAVGLMSKPMRPFHMDMNHNPYTKKHAVPNTLFDHESLGYDYDNFEIAGMNLHQLEEAIHEKQSHARVFAGFLLHGVGTSADVHFEICKTDTDCHEAGVIFILGGSAEMPWQFNRLYKYDITHALEEFGIHPEDVFHDEESFHLKVSITAVNGSTLPPALLHKPTLIYEPGKHHEEDHKSAHVSGKGVRKNVERLTKAEVENLRHAMSEVMADHGPNGYQAIAGFHGNPPMCPMPDGRNLSCCTHGMATFPHWHRLFVKQMEDALNEHGAHIGIPYWEWTTAFKALPSLVTDDHDNPFHEGHIDYLHVSTSRSPRDMLFNDPDHGSTSFFYRQVMLALEQTDFCQFEVQFEIAHNAIHSWTGGHSPYGMSTLEFTAYDPLFWLHHSNTDRIWAIWQALQKHRGLPYNHADCEIQAMKQPLRPFSDEINHNHFTKENSRPTDVFEYSKFQYQYDDLIFHGHTIPELDKILKEKKHEDRTFAAFLLHSIGTSADVTFDICKPNGDCVFAGTFALLGGEYEMKWSFDRLFRYDITHILKQADLRYDSEFTFKVKLVATNDTELPHDLIKDPTIEHEAGDSHHVEEYHEPSHSHTLRKDLNDLSLSEVTDLRDALYSLQNDHGKGGFEAIAGFHGYPNKCPEHGSVKYPCCVHGMPVFPHWHRLHTVQMERALKKHGAHLGIPYWDWTKNMTGLPSFFADSSHENPFHKYTITSNGHATERDVSDKLFHPDMFGEYPYMYYFALQTLEEDNFCDFEVQYEMLHNSIHASLGGSKTFSMATLEYSAFDPVFMIHHSSLDRIWIIWQELQKRRQRPYNGADCLGNRMHAPLHPFSYESVNDDEFTRQHSRPDQVFDHHVFDYEYDHLGLHGNDIDALEHVVNNLRDKERIFAGIVLHGIHVSANVKVLVSGEDKDHEVAASGFSILGGEKEMPWAYERLFRFDITDAVHSLEHTAEDHIRVRMEVVGYMGVQVNTRLPDPFIIHRPAHSNVDVLVIPLGTDIHLPPKVVIKRGTKIKFVPLDASITKPMVELGSYTAMFRCIVPPYTYHGFELNKTYNVEPGDYFIAAGTIQLCERNVRIHIHVANE